MKVLLIGNYAPDQQYSMQGFARALLSGLCERGINARLLVPPTIAGRLHIPKAGKWLGYGDKFIAFPPQLIQAMRAADIVHLCDQGNAIYTKYLARKPHLVTCHDLLAIRAARGEMPDQKTGAAGRLFQRLILAGVARAQAAVCVSQTTREDLLRISGLPEKRVRVIYNGLYLPVEPMLAGPSETFLRSAGISPEEPFLLHVGGNQFYKNRMGLLEIYYALAEHKNGAPMRLIMAGKPFTPEMRRRLAENRLENRVIELVEPDNETLRALYSRAKALIFPSLYEGFGLPLIEAQSCGCPVFASGRAPMTEVGGSGAVYFDPAQPEQAARIIAGNLDNDETMRNAGFVNVRRFSAAQMIEGYIQAYTEILSGN